MLLNARLPLRRFPVVVHVIRYLCARVQHLDEDGLVLGRGVKLLRLCREAIGNDLYRHMAADLDKIHGGAAFRVSLDFKVAVVLAVLGGMEDDRCINQGFAIEPLLDRYNDMGDQGWCFVFAAVLRILTLKHSRYKRKQPQAGKRSGPKAERSKHHWGILSRKARTGIGHQELWHFVEE